MDRHNVLIHPIISEKAVNMIEAENKIVFKVNKYATKEAVKKAMDEIYKIKAVSVNMINDTNGNKKAIIKLDPKHKASEFASKLGMV